MANVHFDRHRKHRQMNKANFSKKKQTKMYCFWSLLGRRAVAAAANTAVRKTIEDFPLPVPVTFFCSSSCRSDDYDDDDDDDNAYPFYHLLLQADII